jgi:hypothetical protein
MGVRNELIDFSDMSGGKNSAFPKHAIAKNQVVDTLNALHEAMGISRAPGYCGITQDWQGVIYNYFSIYSNKLYRAVDPQSEWREITSFDYTTYTPTGSAYGNGILAVACYDSSSNGFVASSLDDGDTWTYKPPTYPTGKVPRLDVYGRIFFINNLFIIHEYQGTIHVSSDAVYFVEQYLPPPVISHFDVVLNDVSYINGVYTLGIVVYGGSYYLYSTNNLAIPIQTFIDSIDNYYILLKSENKSYLVTSPTGTSHKIQLTTDGSSFSDIKTITGYNGETWGLGYLQSARVAGTDDIILVHIFSNYIVKSTNNGTTWSDLISLLTLLGETAASDYKIFSYGQWFIINYSIDSGVTYKWQKSNDLVTWVPFVPTIPSDMVTISDFVKKE